MSNTICFFHFQLQRTYVNPQSKLIMSPGLRWSTVPNFSNLWRHRLARGTCRTNVEDARVECHAQTEQHQARTLFHGCRWRPMHGTKVHTSRGDACSHGSYRGRTMPGRDKFFIATIATSETCIRPIDSQFAPSPSSVLDERILCSGHTIGHLFDDWVIESHKHTRSKSIELWIFLPKIFETSPGLPSRRHLHTPSLGR